MDPKCLRLTQNTYFSFLPHTKQFLLVTFYDTTARNRDIFWTHEQTELDGQTDLKLEIVMTDVYFKRFHLNEIC